MNPEPGTLRYQIYQNMDERQNEELLQIWKKNDRKEWTDDAFEIVRDILLQRLGSVPEQGAPFVAELQAEAPDAAEDEDLDESEEEDSDLFHTQAIVLRIASLADTASRIVLVLGVVVIILGAINNLIDGQQVIANDSSNGIFVALSFFYGIGSGAITWGVDYVILQTISQGLLLLLDIEWNTRPADARGD